MRSRLNDFRNIVEIQGGKLVTNEYSGTNQRYHIICKDGHDAYPIMRNVLNNGQGICNICAKINTGKTRSINAWKRFSDKINELGGQVLETEWKGDGYPHNCICPVGHNCFPRPSDVMRGQGMCIECGYDAMLKWRFNTARTKFITRITELGGTIIDTSYDYLDTTTRIECLCPNGHTCYVSPNSVISGNGMCDKCGRAKAMEYRRNTQGIRTWEEFVERVEDMGGVVIEKDYLGAIVPHKCICINAHKCSPRPHDINRGEGICHKCIGMIWDVFYIVSDIDKTAIKFGISSRTGRKRLSQHALNGYTETIRLYSGLPDGIAKQTETACIIELENNGFLPVYGREYFDYSALPIVLERVTQCIMDTGFTTAHVTKAPVK